MDWNAAIEKNREALNRILAAFVAMAGRAAFTSPLWGFEADLPIEPLARSSAEKAGEIAEQSGSPAKREASGGGTLPRHLHRAVLRLLRPAEAAARRLIIVAARGLVVTLPPARRRKAKPAPTILRKPGGTGILMPHARSGALPGTVYFFPHNGAAGSRPDISGKKVTVPRAPPSVP